MKGFLIFSSLMSGLVISISLTNAHANTLPIMESHGSLKIQPSRPYTKNSYDTNSKNFNIEQIQDKEDLKKSKFEKDSNSENKIIEE